MELVYLWVEDYKNIKKQGFNFSPRFKCEFKDEYDSDDKLKDNCKLIIDKKDSVSIFPDNINITAIVGENGSGKSSILETLSDLLSENHTKDSYFEDEEYRKYILIYRINKIYYILFKHITKEFKLVDNTREAITWIEKNPNNDLLGWHDDIVTLIINNQLKTKKIYRDYEKIFIENTQYDTNRIKKIILSNYLLYKEKLENINNNYFIPNTVKIKVKLYKMKEDNGFYNKETLKTINNLTKSIESDTITRLDLFNKLIEILKIKSQPTENVSSSFVNIDKNVKNRFEFESKYKFTSLIHDNLVDLDALYSKILGTFKDKDKYSKGIFYEFKIDEIKPDILNFLFDLPELVFDIELLQKDISFEALSYGERQLLTQLHYILYNSEKKKYKSLVQENSAEADDIIKETKINNMLIFLDEFELGLHPNWQKKAIKYMISFLKNINKNFNLIIASHSPFILSDLPKENIIFLEDGKQKDKFKNKQTFGANIHTLLSDGFFMSDGLMGEFAKEKINEVIKILKPKKISKKNIKYCQNIISIIGEPILKNTLQNMLDEKLYTNESKIDKLKRQQKELKKEIDELESKSNETS